MPLQKIEAFYLLYCLYSKRIFSAAFHPMGIFGVVVEGPTTTPTSYIFGIEAELMGLMRTPCGCQREHSN
jgi:hypothetical protein